MNNLHDLPFIKNTHKWGKILGFSIATILVVLPIVFCFIYQVTPEWTSLIAGLIGVVPLFGVIGIIEVFTYVPMLGAGGTYLSFVTGNISNLKLPCALDALEKAEVKASSEEGEIISTIAISVCSITTTLIIILGVCLITPLTPVFEAIKGKGAFEQILPALFGALAVVFFSKNIKLALPSCIVMTLLFVFVPALNGSTVSIMVPVGVILTIIVGRIFYKKGIIK